VNIEELALATSLSLTDILMPWAAILLSIVMAMMLKDLTMALVRGIRFKLSNAFNPGDIVIIDSEEATIISIGILRTIFERNGPEGVIWRYVPNERLAFLKLEKVIRTSS